MSATLPTEAMDLRTIDPLATHSLMKWIRARDHRREDKIVGCADSKVVKGRVVGSASARLRREQMRGRGHNVEVANTSEHDWP